MIARVETKETLVSLLREHAEQIRSLGVKKVGLFGSFVRGEQHGESDVDVLVEFEPDRKTFDNFIHLSFLLEDLFHRRVELITSESLSPYLRSHIMNEVEYVPLFS